MRAVPVVHSTVYGGAEAYMCRLYAGLAREGVEPLLVGTIPGWDEAGLERLPLDMSAKWGGTTMLSGALRLPGEVRRLTHVVQGLSPRYTHLQFKREQIGFTTMLAKMAPVVWTEHGRFLRGAKGALLGQAYRHAARSTSVIICVSEEVADDVRTVVGRGPRIETIENSVDTEALARPTNSQMRQARARLGLDPDRPVLLWIGRLHSAKRADFAVELAREWRGQMLIAGDGPLRAEIESATANLPNTFVLGHVKETSLLYRAADVVAFTSSGAGEGFPTILVEAGAHAVPFVTDEGSGGARATRESGGVVLPSTSGAKEWVRALVALASEPDARDSARSWAEEHDVKKWVERHRDVILSAVRT